ncbi:MAG: GumC family protein, partial [Pseudomonadota bacterium]
MSQASAASPDDIDISHVFGAVGRNLFRLILLSVLAGGLVYAITSMIAPRYQSEAALEVIARGAANPFLDPRADGSRSDSVSVRMDKQAVNTHVRAIQSSEIAMKIAKELNLNRLPEFNSALGPVDQLDGIFRTFGIGDPGPGESEEDRVLNAFYRKLTVSSPPDSRVIAISFQSNNPELAARIANDLAETYRQRLASATVVETDDIQKALAPKIAALEAEVAKADAAVSSFRAEAGLLTGGSQKTPLNDQQLGDLTTELTRVSAARTAAEARARNARQLMRRGTPEVIPEVQRSPLIQNLIQQKVEVQRDLLRTSASLKSAHPVIRQLDADLLAVRRQIASEVANIVAGLEKDALVAAEQEGSIRTSLEKVKTTVASKGNEQVKLKQLEGNAASKRAELERLQAQFEKNRARADEAVIPVEARVLTKARPSGVPIAPKKGAWTILTAAAVFLTGLAVVLTRALFQGARQPAQQLAQA